MVSVVGISRKFAAPILILQLLLKTASSLCTDQCQEGYGCQPNEFPCFRDCCIKGESYCDISIGEQRCRFCFKIKHRCDMDSMPVECLLYCDKLQRPTTKPDNGTCVYENLSEQTIATISVLAFMFVLSTGVAITFAVCYVKLKRSSTRLDRKDSKNGSNAEKQTFQDQDIHKGLLGEPQGKDSDKDADSQELQYIPSPFDSNDTSRCSTPKAFPDNQAQDDPETIHPNPTNAQPAYLTNAQPANLTNAQPANLTNAQSANPTDTQPSDIADTPSCYVPTRDTSNGGGALLRANGTTASGLPASTQCGRDIVSPAGNESINASNQQLPIATSKSNHFAVYVPTY